MKVDVSLIVPVYNVNKYITRFFDSIDEQTSYEKQINTEIILVDDGSTDDSGYRCEDYKNNRGAIRIDSVFKHIIVIHQDNKGPAAARNAGIKAASGKYVCFVDPDDYLCPEYVEEAFTVAESTCADIVLFDAYKDKEDEAGNVAFEEWCHGDCDLYRIDKDYMVQLQCGMLYSRMAPEGSDTSIAAPWDKIYRRDFLLRNDLFFREDLKVLDDMVFNFECMGKAEHVAYHHEKLYHYCVRSSSITNSFKPDRPIHDRYVFKYLKNAVEEEEHSLKTVFDEDYYELNSFKLEQAYYARVIKSFAICCRLCFFNEKCRDGNLRLQLKLAKGYMNDEVYSDAFRNIESDMIEWKLRLVRIAWLLKSPRMLYILHLLQEMNR
ncbi:MAG: glycosyltransferase [Butyrivibrio sp.]|nr:glycosyltransferase [Butyrivibrio sp.]